MINSTTNTTEQIEGQVSNVNTGTEGEIAPNKNFQPPLSTIPGGPLPPNDEKNDAISTESDESNPSSIPKSDDVISSVSEQSNPSFIPKNNNSLYAAPPIISEEQLATIEHEPKIIFPNNNEAYFAANNTSLNLNQQDHRELKSESNQSFYSSNNNIRYNGYYNSSNVSNYTSCTGCNPVCFCNFPPPSPTLNSCNSNGGIGGCGGGDCSKEGCLLAICGVAAIGGLACTITSCSDDFLEAKQNNSCIPIAKNILFTGLGAAAGYFIGSAIVACTAMSYEGGIALKFFSSITTAGPMSCLSRCLRMSCCNDSPSINNRNTLFARSSHSLPSFDLRRNENSAHMQSISMSR